MTFSANRPPRPRSTPRSPSGVILASAAVDAIPPPEREFARNVGLAGALGLVMGIGSAYYFAPASDRSP